MDIQSIDFSHFEPDVLRSIETAARFAVKFNSAVIMPCHLVYGLASINGEIVCSVLKSNGYNPHLTMESIANGLLEVPLRNNEDGVNFHPDVVNVIESVSSNQELVSIATLMNSLINSNIESLRNYFVVDDGELETMSNSVRNYHKDDSSTGDTIKQFCVNMLELAAKGKYHHAIGRDREIERILLILARSTKNNPVLIGEPGTGKTAIAEELAIRLLNGTVPHDMANLKLYKLDFSAIKTLPESVDIMKHILSEASNDKLLVLFIDEIHMLISTCNCSDNDIANLLKPAMARGDIKILGATTLDEYKRIEEDPAFERRFQKIIINEPDVDSAVKIIIGSKKEYEKYHDIEIPDDVCTAAVNLSHRYITNRKLPDKAIDLIDEASANLRLQNSNRKRLEINDIMKVITAWTGIPIDDMNTTDMERLQHIEEELHLSVVGQDNAIKAVANTIKRNRMGFSDASKPIGTFLFLGSTGTGKTELCKAIAKFLFNDPNRMVRIDMSEYQQEHSSHRLFGAPPGYVGYEQGGQLTEAIYRKPFNVILFDEIEKAHPKIFDTLLQVLGEGRMTDGKGKTVNFKNTIIVMTSNMGQQNILRNLCKEDVSDCTAPQKLDTKLLGCFL